MSNYFEVFPKIDYDINNDGNPIQVTDTTLRFKFKQALAQNKYNYYSYTIKDGERVDILADKYYGNSKYAWIIMLTNDIINPYYDWPMIYAVFTAYIQSKYGSIATAISTIHHYEQIGILKAGVLIKYPEPIIIQKAVYDLISEGVTKSDAGESIISTVSAYDYELEENEKKRHIQLIDRTYINSVLDLVNNIFRND